MWLHWDESEHIPTQGLLDRQSWDRDPGIKTCFLRVLCVCVCVCVCVCASKTNVTKLSTGMTSLIAFTSTHQNLTVLLTYPNPCTTSPVEVEPSDRSSEPAGPASLPKLL